MTRAANRGRPSSSAARAFRGLRRDLVRNTLRSLFHGSRLRVLMVLLCSVVFWAGLFGLFLEGFSFLDQYFKVSNEIVEYIFGMFFLSLLMMLLFSTGIIVYTGLFQSHEATFLLTTPAPADKIFAFKYAEALAFSSWGFLLLGSPMMVAYGITARAPWPFYVMFFAYLLAFVLIPGGLGAVGAVLVANFLPRRRKAVLVVAVAAVVALCVGLAFRVVRVPRETFAREGLDVMLSQLAFSQHPLLPSRWLSKGLIGSARGQWEDGLFYLAVTAAHGGLAYLLAAVVARDLYRQGYSRVQGGRNSRRRLGGYGFDALFHRAFAFVPRPIRLLTLKDLRAFRRDPAQWSQFLIFFGLLGFYFVNIRRLGYHDQSPYFRNLLSFLNLAVTALILSTFTSRFIFPLLSLEGRNFWVLGLLPLRREQILWGKFAFASVISLVATEALVVLSDLMLRIWPGMIALHVGTVAVLCLGLSGISVGLGARLPNLKEDDPSKIAAGFGGTLNLLVSLVFIFLVVTALAVPCHLYYAGIDIVDPEAASITFVQFRRWLTTAIVSSLVLGVVATTVPLRIGIKAFQKMEF